MALKLSDTTRNLMAKAVADHLAGGSFVLFSGNTILGYVALPNPAFSAGETGEIVTVAVPEFQIIVAGVADRFSLVATGQEIAATGTVTVEGGGGDLEVANTSFAVNQYVRLSSLTLTMPASA